MDLLEPFADRRRFRPLLELFGERLGRLHSRHGKGEIRAQDLAGDQLANVLFGFVGGDVVAGQGLRELLRAGPPGRSLQGLAQLLGFLDGYEMVSPLLSVEPSFDIAQAPPRAVEARVRAEAEGSPQSGVVPQGLDEAEEIVQALPQARPAVGRMRRTVGLVVGTFEDKGDAQLPRDLLQAFGHLPEVGLRLHDARAGEEPERRRPPRHPRKVADDRPLDPLSPLALRLADPHLQRLVEVG